MRARNRARIHEEAVVWISKDYMSARAIAAVEARTTLWCNKAYKREGTIMRYDVISTIFHQGKQLKTS